MLPAFCDRVKIAALLLRYSLKVSPGGNYEIGVYTKIRGEGGKVSVCEPELYV